MLDLGIPEKKARAWVKALRSGKYIQGRQYLTDNGSDGIHRFSYCCLGVYMVGVLGVNPKDLAYIGGVEEEEFRVDPDLDQSVVDEYLKIPFDTRQALAEMNDDHDLTFNEIANEIERSI